MLKAGCAPREEPAPFSHGMLERATMIRASMLQMNFTELKLANYAMRTLI